MLLKEVRYVNGKFVTLILIISGSFFMRKKAWIGNWIYFSNDILRHMTMIQYYGNEHFEEHWK